MPTLAAQGIVAVTYTSTTVLMKVSLLGAPHHQTAASAHFGLLCCCWLQGWGLAANKLIAESVRAGDAEQAKRTAILCCVSYW